MATNFEFYKDEILEAVKYGSPLAVKDNKPVSCRGMKCNECDFKSAYGECNPKRFEWLYAEHVEQPKLTKRERAFCEAAMTGWISRDSSGNLSWRDKKPRKLSKKHDKYWLGNGSSLVCVHALFKEDCFGFIQWEDENPWAVEDLLKLEVIEEGQ